jgi:hypothetical protein
MTTNPDDIDDFDFTDIWIEHIPQKKSFVDKLVEGCGMNIEEEVYEGCVEDFDFNFDF